ncbi:MAG: SLBB domain-containing protein [Gammaproteobacteria bacterium]|nr:SLBB domain-containing protein [Gammaproteobacteria bacterium]
MLSKDKTIQAIRNAGIVGAGGGGFPTYVKLQSEVDTVVANGSECEPILSSDRTMMVKNAKALIDGMQVVINATGAKHGIIGIKGHYHDAVDALKKVLPKDGSIKLHLLENYYPAGDEFLLVYETTGKIIPEGGIPLNVGVVVSNVITFMQIADGVHGKPVTERAVTLAGEFNKPQVVTAPIGTTYNDLIKVAGGFAREDVILIDGGPMMGKIVDDWNAGIAKTTSGILALPKDNFIVRMKQKPLAQMVRQSKSACCQCFRCSDLCPRNLLGHELYPHATMRTIDYNLTNPTKHITSAFLCSQCGVCELVACDFMMLSPRKIYAAYRQELVKKGVRNPHNKKPVKVREGFEMRKLAIPTLMKKTGLTGYGEKLEYTQDVASKIVRIPLNKHAGAPALPIVMVGDKLRKCDVIAASPEDKLGTVYHASIAGTVSAITQDFIEITGSR